MKMTIKAITALSIALLSVPLAAREFRSLQPIFGLQLKAQAPQGAQPLKRAIPVSQERVEQAAKKLLASWNKPDLRAKLSQQFHDADRLQDAVQTSAPLDAKVELLGVSTPRVMQQWRQTSEQGGERLVSRVVVQINHQVEFNRDGQFQRLEGSADYLMDISEPMPAVPTPESPIFKAAELEGGSHE